MRVNVFNFQNVKDIAYYYKNSKAEYCLQYSAFFDAVQQFLKSKQPRGKDVALNVQAVRKLKLATKKQASSLICVILIT